jgi:hypothetical protein
VPEPPPLPAPQRSRAGPNRKQLAVAGVTIAALLGAAAVAVVLVRRGAATTAGTIRSPGPATTQGGITNEDQLINVIRTQGWTPVRAEQLFALDVGPLPGVSVQGITSTGGFDASTAVTALYGQWDHLTPAQRDAANRYLATSHMQAQWSTAPTAPSASAVLLGSTNTPAFDYQALADDANHDEALNTGTALVELHVTVSYAPPPNPTTYAATWLFVRSGIGPWVASPDGCHPIVYNQKFEGLDADSAAAIMAHEVFHCFEYRQEGSGANWETVAPWIHDGESDWVMDILHPGAAVEAPAWATYTATRSTPYAQREYDAVGVYGHEGDVAGDQTTVWSKLLPMVTADIGHHDSAAVTLLMGAGSDHYYSAWGSSYYEDQTHADWRMAGPGTPPTAGPGSDSVTINNDDIKDIASDGKDQAHPITISGNADILIIVLASGYGEAHDQNFGMQKTLDTSAPLWWWRR